MMRFGCCSAMERREKHSRHKFTIYTAEIRFIAKDPAPRLHSIKAFSSRVKFQPYKAVVTSLVKHFKPRSWLVAGSAARSDVVV